MTNTILVLNVLLYYLQHHMQKKRTKKKNDLVRTSSLFPPQQDLKHTWDNLCVFGNGAALGRCQRLDWPRWPAVPARRPALAEGPPSSTSGAHMHPRNTRSNSGVSTDIRRGSSSRRADVCLFLRPSRLVFSSVWSPSFTLV